MMAAFVHTAAKKPPKLRTLLVRSGGSICFACATYFAGWVMIFAGRETSIPAPDQWWDEDAENIGISNIDKIPFRSSAQIGQLTFDLGDSETQSTPDYYSGRAA